jgi:hypothetical protein
MNGTLHPIESRETGRTARLGVFLGRHPGNASTDSPSRE